MLESGKLAPEDFVGWTVTVHENNYACPEGVYHCIGLSHTKSLLCWCTKYDGLLYIRAEYVSRLRQGDFAP